MTKLYGKPEWRNQYPNAPEDPKERKEYFEKRDIAMQLKGSTSGAVTQRKPRGGSEK
jgi:hypothetical protein